MSKEALKLALDLATMHHTDDGYMELRSKVRSALREALAEQPAPVTDTEHINRGCHYQTELTQPAHPCIACGAETGHADWCARVRWGIEKPAQQEPVVLWDSEWGGELLVNSLPNGTPLYTSPPQRKPLTRDQVRETMTEAGYDTASPQERTDFINGIRHAEAAHGIKENT